MREILFKAKRIDNGEWVEGNLIQSPYMGEVRSWISTPEDKTRLRAIATYYGDWRAVEVGTDTICQYTGLTDKNGNKIWENDVLKQSFYIFLENEIESEEISGCEIGVVVIIPTKGTCMKNPLQYVEVNGEIEKNFEKTKMYKGVCQYRCEVIGNIFDNPDLLKGE